MNGIINVYKEKGFTSHDVVAKLRGILKQRKIGHTGTLDPDAEGVLPVCLGTATKLCDMLTDKSKTYETVFKLGITTDTQDLSGQTVKTELVSVNQEEIEAVIMSFVGAYEQIPPMFSAKKVNGKKLYELAREGKIIERKPCSVEIHEITILDVDMEQKEVRMRVFCSKGTYIRTLCHDIGEKLGCGAAMKELLRTKVSAFTLEDSLKLSRIQELADADQVEDYILAPDQVLAEYAAVVLKPEADRFVYNGNALFRRQFASVSEGDTSQYRIYDSKKQFMGIYGWDERQKNYKPVKMFLS